MHVVYAGGDIEGWMVTVEANELKAAVKNPKAFFLDLQSKHLPRLLIIKVRPKLEVHEDYVAVSCHRQPDRHRL